MSCLEQQHCSCLAFSASDYQIGLTFVFINARLLFFYSFAFPLLPTNSHCRLLFRFCLFSVSFLFISARLSNTLFHTTHTQTIETDTFIAQLELQFGFYFALAVAS